MHKTDFNNKIRKLVEDLGKIQDWDDVTPGQRKCITDIINAIELIMASP
jgi:hypothetical protein